MWVGLMRATTSHYEPGFHISWSHKLNSLVKHKIRLQHISGQPSWGSRLLCMCYSSFQVKCELLSLSEDTEPDYEEEGSKEMRWSMFSLNLSGSCTVVCERNVQIQKVVLIYGKLALFLCCLVKELKVFCFHGGRPRATLGDQGLSVGILS